MFLSANANKRSLAISLRDPRGRDALLRLVDGADVFLQSLRPGLAEQLGLGARRPASAQPAPRLLLGRRVRSRRASPRRARLRRADAGRGRAHLDDGGAGRPGVRVGSSLVDQGTGTWAALGVLAALLERGADGDGSVVDVSLYETALGYIGYHLAGLLADGTCRTARARGSRWSRRTRCSDARTAS